MATPQGRRWRPSHDVLVGSDLTMAVEAGRPVACVHPWEWVARRDQRASTQARSWHLGH